MSKIIQRVVYLFFAVLGMYWTFEDSATLATGEVAVRFALVPLALAFFNITFVKGEQNQKVTAISFGLIGLAMAFAGFGFYAMDQVAGLIFGIPGIILIGVSARKLNWALYP